MSRLKKLLSDTVIYGISNVVARLIGYLLVPFFTHVFLPDEYGLISLVFVSLGIFNVFYTAGMESAFLKLASKKDDTTFRKVYSSINYTLALNVLVLSLLLWLSNTLWRSWFGLENIPSIVVGMMLVILSTDALSVCGFAALRLQRRATLFAGLKLGQVIVNAGLTLFLVQQTNWGITAVFSANLMASTTTFLIINVIHLKQLKGTWSRELVDKAFQFGLPFIPAGLAHLVNESFDRFFLLRMQPERIEELYNVSWSAEDIVGIYSACYKLAVFALLLVQMFRMAWQPFFLEHAEDKDAPQLFAKVFLLFNALLIVTWLSISLFTPEIAAIKIPFTEATLIGKAYWGGLHVVPILLAAYIFQGWYVVFTSSIFISGKTKVLAQVTGFGALITLSGNALFTHDFGMEAAAWTTVVSYFFMCMMLWYRGKAWFTIPYSFKRAAFALAFAILIFLSYHMLPQGIQGIGTRLSLLVISLAGIGTSLRYGQKIDSFLKI